MSPTCKLKTFHEYEALICFKFANKDIGIIKNLPILKIPPPPAPPMHYVNITFRFLENSLLQKGKYLVLLNDHIFV